ncbi:aT-rich interactive domain-containing protein 5B isoform X2 [Stigmatopora argus]
MEPNSLKWVGSSCGLHGHYVFYKAFKFASRDAEARILSLGDFFLVRCKPDEPICVAELQLLWEERTSRQLLSSSKLYFLPEDTPQGRDVSHGEHEVIAVSEKVIVRLQDLVKWAVPDFSEWSRGLKAEPLKASVLRELGTNGRREALHRYRESTLTSGLNFKDVQRERARLGQEEDGRKVLVLSYPQYCRYRSVLVRLRERPTSMLLNHTVLALGGIAALGGNTRILYCRDTFEHPTLLQNDSICDQFAPNLKGRPRKKKLSISQRRDSGTAHYLNSPETKNHKVKTSCRALANGKLGSSAKHKTGAGLGRKPEKERAVESAEERSEQEENAYPSPLEEEQKEEEEEEPEEQEATVEEVAEEEEEEEEEEESREDEQAFLVELYKYMKKRDTPIERIPFLGFKQINLWTMFQAAQKLGGYELITVRRQWKHVYDELGGNPSSTSAATCTRRHYERLLLPYERHLKGEQDKPLPLSKPRNHEKAPPAKVKGVAGVKKVKVPSGVKTVRKDRGEMAATQRQSQDSKAEVSAKPEVPAVDEPIVIEEEEEEEEEELQVTLKEEESLAGESPAVAPLCFKEAESGRAPLAPLAPRPLHPGAQPEWRKISEVLQAAKTEVHPVARSTYPPHLRDQNKPPGRDEPSESHGGGRAARVPSACKQDRRSVESGGDPFPEKDDYAAIQRDAPSQMAAAYCKTGQGVMSPLAKKKLLSQACESTSFCFASSFRPPPASERDGEKWRGEEEPPRRHVHDGVPEAAPVFRPSVIQHAQSSKPPRDPAPAPSPVGAPWQPFLPRTRERDGAADKISEKLLRSRGFAAGDCYSSPHLHSLYRQTEHCLSRDQMGGYVNGERAEPFSRDRDGEQGFVCCGLEKEGLAYRSHYSDEARTGDADDGPRDFSLSKALSQRLSKASFCALPYPMAHVPKGCRASPPMREPSPPYPSPKPLLESSLVRPAKRLVGEPEGEEAPERKLRPCQAEEASHAVAHLDKGHSAYALARAAPLYANMYPPGGLVSQDGLQRHPGLQYLKSQSAVSPLVPPLAFHSMMLHRQLLASAPGPHHLFRHPGGAAFCGDLLHQLYPLSTLPPPQLSSVHPSTRL